MSEPSVYIISAARTPVGGFQGELKDLTAPQLGAAAIRATLERSDIAEDEVGEVIIGNVISAGLKQAPARQAMRQAGLPDSCPATTINKVCGSGMKATMLAYDLIRTGNHPCMIAGGMESMTNAPYLMANARQGARIGHTDLKDAMFFDGLEDADTGAAMGTFAQTTADEYQFTRAEMDAYAVESVKRARKATESGWLDTEIVPLTVMGANKTEVQITADEQPKRAKLEKIPKLRPAFKDDGTITAANSSSISDGASALLLADEALVQEKGLKPLARIVAHTSHAHHPSKFTTAPVMAIEKLLEKTGWSKDSVDLFEINEAFAMVTMIALRDLQIDPAKLNIYGGACAQGHPIGSTGSRLIVTLAHAMQRLDKQRGIAALCIGGGEATAIAIERV
ncbi:MAG: thiolase family protein [Pseudomonadales bacterium]|nr:thiolase family protein [Pseudomonadales bacterium]